MSIPFPACAVELLLSVSSNLGNFAQDVVFFLETQENPSSFTYQDENWSSEEGIDMLRASFSSHIVFIPRVAIKNCHKLEALK